MKLTKRVLATLVAVVFVLTSFVTVPSFAAFTDLTESDNSYEAVNVLNKLGVINGYDDGSFKPLNNVTRAEFTAMLLRTRGMGNVGSTSLENPPFPDVTTPDVSWAIANIRTAREMGIINGYDDGTFKPNNNVSYEEAVKMIVCALGYGEMGSEGAFWYSKYLMTAKSLGFLDGAGGAVATPATRATIANMLYNCLEVKLAENNAITDKTILENDLKLTKNVGYISSNPQISLSKPDANLRDDEVEITVGNVASTYKVDDNSKYNDMLGAQIEFYYQNDFNSGLKHLILATVKNSTTVKVDADSLQDGSTSGISYLKSEDAERETALNIASNSVVVYNGKLYGADAENSTFTKYYTGESGKLPLVGDLELIDRDGDNVFDVVFVNDYEPYFVSSVTSSDYKVTDNAIRNGQTGGANQVVLNYKSNDISFYTPDGATTSFSAIKKGSVIFVAKAKGSTGDAKVIVCNDTVSGKITATGTSKGYTINGKDYKASNLAPWENSLPGASPTLTVAPQMGDTAKFYLDLSGRVIWYDKTEVASNQQYGYVTGAKYDNGNFEETALVNIVTKSNTQGVQYTITTKSKLNNTTYATLSEFVKELDKANNHGVENQNFEQLVKFTTSKGTEIDEIITYEDKSTGGDIVVDKLYRYKNISKEDECEYNSSSKQLEKGTTEKIYIGSALILSTPSNSGAAGKYKVMSLDDLENNGKYKVEFFDVTGTNSAKVVVVYDGAANVGEVKGNSPVVVIKEIETMDKNGENRYVIKGYEGKNLKEWVLSVSDNTTVTTASDLKIGDVIRVGTDSEGYYTVKPEHIIFSMDPPTYRDTAIGYGDNPGSYPKKEAVNGNIAYRVIWGSAYQYDGDDGNRFIVATDVLAANQVASDTYALEKSKFSGAQIFRFNANEKELIQDITGDGYESILGSLKLGNTDDKPSEIFIHMTGNTDVVKTMIIVER